MVRLHPTVEVKPSKYSYDNTIIGLLILFEI